MTGEDSSTASLKEILAQVHVFKLIKQDVAEPKHDLKQMQEKIAHNEDLLAAHKAIYSSQS